MSYIRAPSAFIFRDGYKTRHDRTVYISSFVRKHVFLHIAFSWREKCSSLPRYECQRQRENQSLRNFNIYERRTLNNICSACEERIRKKGYAYATLSDPSQASALRLCNKLNSMRTFGTTLFVYYTGFTKAEGLLTFTREHQHNLKFEMTVSK